MIGRGRTLALAIFIGSVAIAQEVEPVGESITWKWTGHYLSNNVDWLRYEFEVTKLRPVAEDESWQWQMRLKEAVDYPWIDLSDVVVEPSKIEFIYTQSYDQLRCDLVWHADKGWYGGECLSCQGDCESGTGPESGAVSREMILQPNKTWSRDELAEINRP